MSVAVHSAVAGLLAVSSAAVYGLIFLLGIAAALVAALVIVRVHSARQIKPNKYGCPECGYSPSRDDIAKGGEYPCPKCSEPVYPKE